MNVSLRLRRGNNFCFSVKRNDSVSTVEECRSQFGQELTGTNFEGGVFEILPGTVLL